MAKTAAWGVVVLAAVAVLVAAEADPGHHGVGGGRPYYKRPYYKRPYYYSQRQPQGGVGHGLHNVGHLPHSGHSEAIGSHSSLGHPSVSHIGEKHDSHSLGHDTHSTLGHAVATEGLYPGLREGYSFYKYKPSAGHDGCSDWCYSSGSKQYYCCYETLH